MIEQQVYCVYGSCFLEMNYIIMLPIWNNEGPMALDTLPKVLGDKIIMIWMIFYLDFGICTVCARIGWIWSIKDMVYDVIRWWSHQLITFFCLAFGILKHRVWSLFANASAGNDHYDLNNEKMNCKVGLSQRPSGRRILSSKAQSPVT